MPTCLFSQARLHTLNTQGAINRLICTRLAIACMCSSIGYEVDKGALSLVLWDIISQ